MQTVVGKAVIKAEVDSKLVGKGGLLRGDISLNCYAIVSLKTMWISSETGVDFTNFSLFNSNIGWFCGFIKDPQHPPAP
jgi:hypothetical protein